MKFFPNFRTILSIGGFDLRWYPVLLCSAGIIIYLLTKRDLKKKGYPEDIGDDLFIGCTIGGVVGARLWFCAFYDLEYYLSNPVEILKTWNGGLAIQGAIAGATIFIYFYTKKKHYSFMRVLDSVFPYILIGQALGRWGNFFNHEAFGQITTAEKLSYLPEFIRENMFINGEYRQPTFLYESVLSVIGFIIINFVYRKVSKPKRGDLVYAYLMWYGVERTVVEYFRSDSLMIGNLKMAIVTALFFMIVGAIGMFGFFRKYEKKPVVIFDFDQTLVNSAPIIQDTFKVLFERHLPDHPFTDEERKYVLGPTLVESFIHFGFKEDPNQLVDEYREVNDKLHTKEHLQAMPNAKELLMKLKEEGYKIGVVSNKLTRTINKGAEICEIDSYIDAVYGLDKVVDVKPNPEGIHKCTIELGGIYDSCIYVGDSVGDVKTGVNAYAYTIGYSDDVEHQKELEEAKANIVVDDLMKIDEILKEDHSWTIDLT